MSDSFSFQILQDGLPPIVAFASEEPCLWAIYRQDNENQGILWACPNGAAGFIPNPGADEDGQQSAQAWRSTIFELQRRAQIDNQQFDSVAWLNLTLDQFSTMLIPALIPGPQPLRYEALEREVQNL